jgi:DnaK suppressor protein
MATAVRAVRRGVQGVSDYYRKLEELRQKQLEELGVRLRDLRESWQPSETVDSKDIEALSDNASNVGVGAAVLEITSRTLQGIEGALRRMKNGKYGECMDCKGAISAARLRALPFAERCRDCEEIADAQGIVLAG